MPKLWAETIASHRQDVRDAILDTTAALVEEHGLLSVTMSRIADATGIGRATLYKYFPDVEAVLRAWHDRQIGTHLRRLAEVRDRTTDPGDRLDALLDAYARIAQRSHGHHDAELEALLHRDERVGRARREVREMFRDAVAGAARAGDVRDDVPPEELAIFCHTALSAAGAIGSEAAVRRLVAVTRDALRPRS